MVSSTVRDLPQHRERARAACLDLGCFPNMMEHHSVLDANAVQKSLQMVDEADIYVGVFGFRYGYIPPGHTKSITQLEYERAVAREIPRLIFLMHEDHAITVGDVETGDGAPRIRSLRAHLETERVVSYFRTVDEFYGKLAAALAVELVTPPKAKAKVRISDPSVPDGGMRTPANLHVSRGDLFRIETRADAEREPMPLTIDLGFFRGWIRCAGGDRLDVVCGCMSAQASVMFRVGESIKDPTPEQIPNGARHVVEFGTGTEPRFRLEIDPPTPFLEGRARLVFDVGPSSDDQAPAMTVTAKLAGTVLLRPESFAADRPAGAIGPPLSEEARVAINALFLRLLSARAVRRSFSF